VGDKKEIELPEKQYAAYRQQYYPGQGFAIAGIIRGLYIVTHYFFEFISYPKVK